MIAEWMAEFERNQWEAETRKGAEDCPDKDVYFTTTWRDAIDHAKISPPPILRGKDYKDHSLSGLISRLLGSKEDAFLQSWDVVGMAPVCDSLPCVHQNSPVPSAEMCNFKRPSRDQDKAAVLEDFLHNARNTHMCASKPSGGRSGSSGRRNNTSLGMWGWYGCGNTPAGVIHQIRSMQCVWTRGGTIGRGYYATLEPEYAIKYSLGELGYREEREQSRKSKTKAGKEVHYHVLVLVHVTLGTQQLPPYPITSTSDYTGKSLHEGEGRRCDWFSKDTADGYGSHVARISAQAWYQVPPEGEEGDYHEVVVSDLSRITPVALVYFRARDSTAAGTSSDAAPK